MFKNWKCVFEWMYQTPPKSFLRHLYILGTPLPYFHITYLDEVKVTSKTRNMYIARGKKVQDKIKDWNFINQKVVIRERFCKPYPKGYVWMTTFGFGFEFEIHWFEMPWFEMPWFEIHWFEMPCLDHFKKWKIWNFIV